MTTSQAFLLGSWTGALEDEQRQRAKEAYTLE